ncbi:MAG: rhodanese-like domain-containing protein [Gammaproteobacteria bacterium]|nr:rhodanese-like domain-containing protein [Gammaproteobacteria bacterium]
MFARMMGVATISPWRLHQKIQCGAVSVFDATSPGSWLNGHVPGAVNIDPAEYPERHLPEDKNSCVVFYCSGPWSGASPYAARRAKQMGYVNVCVLSSGICGWRAAELPLEQGIATAS